MLAHAGHIRNFGKKRVSHRYCRMLRGKAASEKIRLRRRRSLISFGNDDCLNSPAQEQPQQNDHRNRYAQKPEQNSSSHYRLLEKLDRFKNAEGNARFQ
jgi:hypothetical protein